MKNLTKFGALLILIIVGLMVGVLVNQKHTLVRQLKQTNQQLTQTQSELKQTKLLLAQAEEKLGYLNEHKTSVQVTAFTKQPNSSHFANGRSIYKAYAVNKRKLPEDAIVNVALSPVAQRRLKARLGDLLVIMEGKKGRRKTIARFVDTTYAGETRPVVDVFFANPAHARSFGRRYDFFAVNLSEKGSPFRLN